MSLISMLSPSTQIWEDLDYPHSLFDQNFGLELHPDQLLVPQHFRRYFSPEEMMCSRFAPYLRPWGEILRQADADMSTINSDKDKFQVTLDVQQFKPDEINVKIVDKSVVIEAKHEEKKDEHGWISRQFVRRYVIPEQCDIEKLTSSLSSDGVLTIAAPKKDVPSLENERKIPIQHTGKPAIRSSSKKECKKAVKKAEKMET